MKYAAVLSLAALAFAKPEFNNLSFDVEEGQPFTLEFSGCESGCTILLVNGPSGNLKEYEELTGSASGGSFTFTPSDMPSDTYAFQIIDNQTDETNYSLQFEYEGTAASTSASMTTMTSTSMESSTTTVPSTTTESTTTPSSTVTSETTMTSMTSATSTEASTTTDDSITTTATGSQSATDIPDPDGAGSSLAAPLTLVAAVAAAMLLVS